MSVLDKAHPRVKAFVEACGAKVLSLDEFDIMIGGMSQRGRTIAASNAGFYNVTHDAIVINTETPNAIAILDRTILHELGHWSGRSSRLQRKVIVHTEKNLNFKNEELEKEEIIAELVAFQLGTEMGLMTKEWEAKSENYIGTFRNATPYGCRDDVKQAVWFLIKIATPNLRSA